MANIRKIDPILLEAFVAIVDGGSFAAAAETVGRTTSAVSMQMKRLEELLPNKIFESHGRTKRLTASGEVLLAHARVILKLSDTMMQSMIPVNAPGVIRLGSPDDYVYTLLPDILDRYAQSFPDVRVEVTCQPSEELAGLIAHDKLDLALVTRRADDKESETVRREPIVWVAAAGRTFAASEPLPLAMFQPGCVARAKTIEACTMAGRDYRIAYSSPSIAGLLSPVRAGRAVAAIARCSVPDDLQIIEASSSLPAINAIEIALMRGKSPKHPDFVHRLASDIQTSLRPA